MKRLLDTPVGRANKLVFNAVEEFAIEHILLEDGLLMSKGNGFYYISPEITTKELPIFNFPVSFTYSGQSYTIFDVREYLNIDGKVRNSQEVSRIYERAVLANEWENNEGHYDSVMIELAKVYGMWISQVIGSMRGINERENLIIRALAGIYFRMSTWDKQDYDNSRARQEVTDIMHMMLTRHFTISNEDVDMIIAVLEDIVKEDTPMNLNSFFRHLPHFTDNPALRLDAGAIITGCAKGWAGKNAIDIAAMAADYPPMFTYMVYCTQHVSFYRKTKFGGVVSLAKRERVALDMVYKWAHNLIVTNEE